ncbi:MAG: membrane-bound lytic murein transglycosylase MltF [Rhodocyclaceae bacterium]|nr:membrane-bound lytic murein transglycosylase MltF [Rhodocyclaceae bacterium]
MLRLAVAMLLAWLLTACERAPGARLLDYQELGELRVATRQDAGSLRIGPDGAPEGFEHDLLLALGERLGVPVRFEILPTSASALKAVELGNVHFAAAGLVRNDAKPVRWSPPLRIVDYVLVGNAGGNRVSDETGLAGHRIGVRRGSVPAVELEHMKRRVPGLHVAFARIGGETELLERVARGELEFAAADRLTYQMMNRYHPELQIAMPLDLRAEMAWALPRDASDRLARAIEDFVADARTSGLLERITERYFGHVQRLDEQRISAFLARAQTRLPKYRPLFVEAARQYGLDWRLLAAVAYQESQWDPTATSYTGVRGMMMLTNETASRLGVENRLDARESIMGGARYLAMLRDELPPEVDEPDRSWMAVAAYNVGMGHLRGAGAIARSLSKDDTSWKDMKNVLPLIAQPAYAARLSAGRGRGGEAVVMAESVRNYYEILARLEPAEPLVSDDSLEAAGVTGSPVRQGVSASTPPM